LSVDEGNIEDLMRVFSGFDDGHSQVHNYGSLGEFYNSDIANPDVENKMNNEKIKPYVRAGGALTSGTAASFYHDTHLFNVNDSTLNDNQKNALDNGRYGKDRQVYDTDEANSRA
jgi:hypothetical protein